MYASITFFLIVTESGKRSRKINGVYNLLLLFNKYRYTNITNVTPIILCGPISCSSIMQFPAIEDTKVPDDSPKRSESRTLKITMASASSEAIQIMDVSFFSCSKIFTIDHLGELFLFTSK